MRFFIFILSVTTSLFYPYMRGVLGQMFEQPSVFYENMTLDATLRGSFNLSDCLKEMINCFELLRPDVVCERDTVHDTACGVMRGNCHDYYGNYDSYSHRFELYDEYCRSDGNQVWT